MQRVDGQSRRKFLSNTVAATAAAGLTLNPYRTAVGAGLSNFRAGQASVDITPPLGIEMGGFHRAPDNPRVVTGIRQPAAIRTLVLDDGTSRTVIASVDLLGMSREMATRVRKRIERECGVPAKNAHLCATHSHSMPSFRFLRQWGAISPAYMRVVEDKTVASVSQAIEDLAPAECYIGSQATVGANFNRTSDTWKTDQAFTDDSTDDDRWLDTQVHVLHIERSAHKNNLLWYHFCAHPVCYTDGQAGPDWPGHVEQIINERFGIVPSLLQGHIGDVNPGNGEPWLGVADKTAALVSDGIGQAIQGARSLAVTRMRSVAEDCLLPLDMKLFQQQLTTYKADPSKCTSGEWVDRRFADDWFKGASKWPTGQTTLATPISALQLNDVALLFHTAELYSFYGLKIRHDSPFKDSVLVGYADGFAGYLTDPKAYVNNEYAAMVVPKILDLPPFTPDAAHHFSQQAGRLLQRLAS